MIFLWLKWLHLLSAMLLFGTGLGTAWYFWRANRQGDPVVIAAVARQVVLADWLFTAPAVILQPVTGVWLALGRGFPLQSSWLLVSLVLYALAGLCWLPVLWIQLRLRTLAQTAATEGTDLPREYDRLYRWWFALGWPAFGAVLVILWLMVFKPA